ncbi:MAG: MFS transporter [Gemmatimonadota bacterium]
MPREDSNAIDRRKLFAAICLTLVPSGASFGLISNVVLQLKEQFILTNYQVGLITGAAIWGTAISLVVLGSLLETYGLKNGFRLGFAAHLTGLTVMLSAIFVGAGDAAFWMLLGGAATLSVGNGMMVTAGDPLVVALYPEEKTTRLNLYHAFFPIGIMFGGITGFLLANYGGTFRYWPFQLAVIYLPILAYGALVLPQKFPKTENAQAGLPIREMFRYTLTRPLFMLMLVMMGIGSCMELASMRWVPSVLQAAGIHGILVLVWISGLMMLLRMSAGQFVKRFAPNGMLVLASAAMGLGLFLLSHASGIWTALGAATVYAMGPAFFFPTMVGSVSERMPRTGSLGIVLTAGIGLGSAGAIGVPVMGNIADRYLVEVLDPTETVALLNGVAARFPLHVGSADVPQVAVSEALATTSAALGAYRATGEIEGDATANALRAIVKSRLAAEQPLVDEARAILLPAEAHGGQIAFRRFAPLSLILVAVFGTMYLIDRRRGGYRATRLEAATAPGGPPAQTHPATAAADRPA